MHRGGGEGSVKRYHRFTVVNGSTRKGSGVGGSLSVFRYFLLQVMHNQQYEDLHSKVSICFI